MIFDLGRKARRERRLLDIEKGSRNLSAFINVQFIIKHRLRLALENWSWRFQWLLYLFNDWPLLLFILSTRAFLLDFFLFFPFCIPPFARSLTRLRFRENVIVNWNSFTLRRAGEVRLQVWRIEHWYDEMRFWLRLWSLWIWGSPGFHHSNVMDVLLYEVSPSLCTPGSFTDLNTSLLELGEVNQWLLILRCWQTWARVNGVVVIPFMAVTSWLKQILCPWKWSEIKRVRKIKIEKLDAEVMVLGNLLDLNHTYSEGSLPLSRGSPLLMWPLWAMADGNHRPTGGFPWLIGGFPWIGILFYLVAKGALNGCLAFSSLFFSFFFGL